jgi:hypothetical protein
MHCLSTTLGKGPSVRDAGEDVAVSSNILTMLLGDHGLGLPLFPVSVSYVRSAQPCDQGNSRKIEYQ